MTFCRPFYNLNGSLKSNNHFLKFSLIFSYEQMFTYIFISSSFFYVNYDILYILSSTLIFLSNICILEIISQSCIAMFFVCFYSCPVRRHVLDHSCFSQLSIWGHLGCFHSFAFTRSAAYIITYYSLSYTSLLTFNPSAYV